jgi:hypothetical protein
VNFHKDKEKRRGDNSLLEDGKRTNKLTDYNKKSSNPRTNPRTASQFPPH